MLEWVAQRIPAMGAGYEWQMAEAVGLVAKGEIIAGMAVHTFLPHFKSCEVTFAATSPIWATKQSIKALLWWPFVQLGCERITCITAASNKRANRICEGIGFKLEGTCRKGCYPDDALIWGLLKEETPEWMGLR